MSKQRGSRRERAGGTTTADGLIDAHECAALGRVSRTTWRRLVCRQQAPQPVPLPIQTHRWRRSEVLRFWGLAEPEEPEGSGS